MSFLNNALAFCEILHIISSELIKFFLIYSLYISKYEYVESLLTDRLMCFQVKKRDCIWSGVDYSEDPPVHKKFMAKFSSEEAATEFQNTFQEVCSRAIFVEQSNSLIHSINLVRECHRIYLHLLKTRLKDF
jgi:hypothetical protein